MRRVILFDNGSLAPESTLQLRRLARELAERLECEVIPASLAHSDKIPAAQLLSEPAMLLNAALEKAANDCIAEIVTVPLFIGPSHAITRHVPALVEQWKKHSPDSKWIQARPLFVPGEERLGEILAEQIHREMGNQVHARVAVVDHGSPARLVAEARDVIAAQVRNRLGADVIEVSACSMERREGAEFDFNEPTLEQLLARPAWRTGPLIVALLFIAPGRHAGPDGDVAHLVRVARSSDLPVRFTRLLGSHPRLIDILIDRVREAAKRTG